MLAQVSGVNSGCQNSSLDEFKVDALLKLSKAHFKGGNRATAEKLAIRAYMINSEDPAANSAMGVICLAKGDARSAEKFLRRAIELGTDDHSVYGNLGTLYFSIAMNVESPSDRDDLMEAATQLYFEAYDMEPGDERTNANISALLHAAFKDAEPDNPLPEYFLKKAITLNPSNDVNWINISTLTGRPAGELRAIYRVSKAELREARFFRSVGKYKLAAIRAEQSLGFYGVFPEKQIEYAELCLLAYQKTNDPDFLGSGIDALEDATEVLEELVSLERESINSQAKPLLERARHLIDRIKKEVRQRESISV